MKNIILQLPEHLNNYVKDAKSTDITVSVQNKYILIVCRCVIYNKQYTSSIRTKLNDRMSNIVRKITKCLDEIKDIYILEKSMQVKGEKTEKIKNKSEQKKTEEVQPAPVESTKKISTSKRERSKEKDDPTFMVAGVTLQELANKVRVNRYARKMSRTQYASKLGIGYSSLWYLESGLRIPRNPDVVRRILAYTNGKNV